MFMGCVHPALVVGLKLCTSHLCEKNSVSSGDPNEGPQRWGPHAMETIGTMVIPVLAGDFDCTDRLVSSTGLCPKRVAAVNPMSHRHGHNSTPQRKSRSAAFPALGVGAPWRVQSTKPVAAMLSVSVDC